MFGRALASLYLRHGRLYQTVLCALQALTLGPWAGYNFCQHLKEYSDEEPWFHLPNCLLSLQLLVISLLIMVLLTREKSNQLLTHSLWLLGSATLVLGHWLTYVNYEKNRTEPRSESDKFNLYVTVTIISLVMMTPPALAVISGRFPKDSRKRTETERDFALCDPPDGEEKTQELA